MADTKDKDLIFAPRTHDLKEFEELGKKARDAGFTHLVISELAERADFQGEEKDSPWCEWSAILPAVFKHVTPPGLEEAYPKKMIQQNMEYMLAMHAICEKLDMKAAYYGTEPHWLNENVYKAHPKWRGSRVDNSLRATGMYFAPDTDNPEVREAYRQGVKMMIEACPRLEIFTFNTNDSGGFYPWEKRLFNGINGPTGTLGQDMGKRVTGFLKALRQGSLDAGGDARVFTNVYGWFVDDELHLVLRTLEPGIGVNGICPGEHEYECSLLNCGGHAYQVGPMFDKAGAVLSGMNGANNVKTGKARVYMGGSNSDDYFTAFKKSMTQENPGNQRGRIQQMHETAVEVYGQEAADKVVDAWLLIEKAHTQADAVGVSTFSPPVLLRWITRPLVAHQDLLTDEEKEYWAKYIYQSEQAHPDVYLDYLNVSGYNFCYNWEQATTKAIGVDQVEGTLKAAAEKFEAAAEKTEDTVIKKKLIMESYRTLAERSVFLTARHVLQVATLIYLRDEQREYEDDLDKIAADQRPGLPKGELGDNGMWFMFRALRWELDNVYDLIDLMKKAPEPLFFTAPHPSLAGPLYLENNLLENIEKKAEIMLRHWRDAEKGYKRPTYGG